MLRWVGMRVSQMARVSVDYRPSGPGQLTKATLEPYLQGQALGELGEKELALLGKKMVQFNSRNELHWARVLGELSERLLAQSIGPRASSSLLLQVAKSRVLREYDRLRALEVPVVLQLTRSPPDPRHVTQYLAAFSRHRGCSQEFTTAMEAIVLRNLPRFCSRELASCLYSLSCSQGRPTSLLREAAARFNARPETFNLNEMCLLMRVELAEGLDLLDSGLLASHACLKQRECNAEDLADLLVYFCSRPQS
jgi:hypothetical protein